MNIPCSETSFRVSLGRAGDRRRGRAGSDWAVRLGREKRLGGIGREVDRRQTESPTVDRPRSIQVWGKTTEWLTCSTGCGGQPQLPLVQREPVLGHGSQMSAHPPHTPPTRGRMIRQPPTGGIPSLAAKSMAGMTSVPPFRRSTRSATRAIENRDGHWARLPARPRPWGLGCDFWPMTQPAAPWLLGVKCLSHVGLEFTRSQNTGFGNWKMENGRIGGGLAWRHHPARRCDPNGRLGGASNGGGNLSLDGRRCWAKPVVMRGGDALDRAWQYPPISTTADRYRTDFSRARQVRAESNWRLCGPGCRRELTSEKTDTSKGAGWQMQPAGDECWTNALKFHFPDREGCRGQADPPSQNSTV